MTLTSNKKPFTKVLALGFTAIMFLSSCTYAISDYGNDGYAIKDPIRVDAQGKLAYFIGGIGQTQIIDAAKACRGEENVLQTEIVQTFADWILAVITIGIYTPISYRVYCKNTPR